MNDEDRTVKWFKLFLMVLLPLGLAPSIFESSFPSAVLAMSTFLALAALLWGEMESVWHHEQYASYYKRLSDHHSSQLVEYKSQLVETRAELLTVLMSTYIHTCDKCCATTEEGNLTHWTFNEAGGAVHNCKGRDSYRGVKSPASASVQRRK